MVWRYKINDFGNYASGRPAKTVGGLFMADARMELERMEQVMVESIEERLGCSVQPIYSCSGSMAGLREDVAERAYIQLAKGELHSLGIFIFQERKNVSSLDDLYQSEANPWMAKFIYNRNEPVRPF